MTLKWQAIYTMQQDQHLVTGYPVNKQTLFEQSHDEVYVWTTCKRAILLLMSQHVRHDKVITYMSCMTRHPYT